VPPVCPKCGKQAQTSSTRYGPRHSCCGLHSWDGKPLVDQATHDARQAAHAAFDQLWKVHGFGRKHAYRLLAEQLQLTKEETHMALMPMELAKLVPAAVDRILEKHPTEGKDPIVRAIEHIEKQFGPGAFRRGP